MSSVNFKFSSRCTFGTTFCKTPQLSLSGVSTGHIRPNIVGHISLKCFGIFSLLKPPGPRRLILDNFVSSSIGFIEKSN